MTRPVPTSTLATCVGSLGSEPPPSCFTSLPLEDPLTESLSSSLISKPVNYQSPVGMGISSMSQCSFNTSKIWICKPRFVLRYPWMQKLL